MVYVEPTEGLARHLPASVRSNIDYNRDIFLHREITPDDHMEIETLFRTVGHPAERHREPFDELAPLLGQYIRGVIIERLSRDTSERRIHAACIVGFLTPRALKAYLDSDYSAFFGMELLSRVNPTIACEWLLDDKMIASQNAGPGLDAFILRYLVPELPQGDISSPECQACQESAYKAVEKCVAGYNLKSIRFQGKAAVASAYLAAGFKVERNYPVGAIASFPKVQLRSERMTYFYSRALHHNELQGSPISRMFQFTPPIFGLTLADREVVLLALDGLTNEQIASRLSISTSAVKNRWDRIFARTDKIFAPEILADRSISSGRGSERRRSVLRYLQSHPEETRPYGANGFASGADA